MRSASGQGREFVKVLPSCLFLLATLIAPICYFLYQSVANVEIPNALPRTIAALEHWQPPGQPPEHAYVALAADLLEIQDTPALFKLARRLNDNRPGYRSLVLRAANDLPQHDEVASYREHFVQLDARWGQPNIWIVLTTDADYLTFHYLLRALDLGYDVHGHVSSVDTERAIYRDVYIRTFWMSTVITGLCLILAYPVAFLLANVKGRHGTWLFYAVLLPFWTSLLVRTLAWIVLFQNDGVIDSTFEILGAPPGSIELLHTRPAVYIGMVHIMLPFMIVSLFAVMKGISPWYMRAALSLGANPIVAFFRVYVPQSAPGIGAGIMLVSIMSLGFYITPALLGGPGDQMISFFIAFNTNESVNWGLAAALGSWLLIFAGGLFLVVSATFGINRQGMR